MEENEERSNKLTILTQYSHGDQCISWLCCLHSHSCCMDHKLSELYLCFWALLSFRLFKYTFKIVVFCFSFHIRILSNYVVSYTYFPSCLPTIQHVTATWFRDISVSLLISILELYLLRYILPLGYHFLFERNRGIDRCNYSAESILPLFRMTLHLKSRVLFLPLLYQI